MTWKVRTTPLGRSIFQLAASERRTEGTDFTSWPTPIEGDWKGQKRGDGKGDAQMLCAKATLASWPTPRTEEPNEDQAKKAERMKKYSVGPNAMSLGTAAQLTGWRSPQHSDGEGGVMEIRPGTAGKYKLRDEVHLAGWATPTDDDANNGTRQSGTFKSLTRDARLTSWKTPNCPRAHDSDNTVGKYYETKKQVDLADQARLTASGETQNGSTAPTTNTGQLNPEHSRYLMGLPAEWGYCGATAMRSSRRLPRRSSKVI